MQTENRYLTIRQTAYRLGLPEFRVRAWQKTGKLPGFNSGNRFYIDAVQLQAMLDEGRMNEGGAIIPDKGA